MTLVVWIIITKFHFNLNHICRPIVYSNERTAPPKETCRSSQYAPPQKKNCPEVNYVCKGYAPKCQGIRFGLILVRFRKKFKELVNEKGSKDFHYGEELPYSQNQTTVEIGWIEELTAYLNTIYKRFGFWHMCWGFFCVMALNIDYY